MTHGGHRRRFAGSISVRPAAVGRENLPAGSSGCPPPPCPACVASGRPVVPPWSKPPRLANGQTAQLGVHGFGEFFLGFWSSRWCFGG